jgi:ribosome maturation factor RimP
MSVAAAGRRRFRGYLLGVEGDAARLRRDDAMPDEPAEVLLRIEDMAEAKVMLSEAQIAASLKRAKAQQRDEPADGATHTNGAAAAEPDGQRMPESDRQAAQNEGE